MPKDESVNRRCRLALQRHQAAEGYLRCIDPNRDPIEAALAYGAHNHYAAVLVRMAERKGK